jgi:hypothetical protein
VIEQLPFTETPAHGRHDTRVPHSPSGHTTDRLSARFRIGVVHACLEAFQNDLTNSHALAELQKQVTDCER